MTAEALAQLAQRCHDAADYAEATGEADAAGDLSRAAAAAAGLAAREWCDVDVDEHEAAA
jgi:ClpP class serine protease